MNHNPNPGPSSNGFKAPVPGLVVENILFFAAKKRYFHEKKQRQKFLHTGQ